MATDDDDVPCLGDLFVCRDYDTLRYEFTSASDAAVVVTQDLDALAGANSSFDLTGQVVWQVSQLTSWYVATAARGDLRGRPCLELGAGAGLCGLVATQYASQVVLTDNEPVVLELLQRNLRHAAPGCDARVFDLSWGDAAQHVALAAEVGRERWPVLLGADVVYWSESITPLMDTVARLLDAEGVLILGFTNRRNGLQAALEEAARGVGLAWTTVPHSAYLPDPVPAKFVDHLPKMTLYRFVWAPGRGPAAGGGTAAPAAEGGTTGS